MKTLISISLILFLLASCKNEGHNVRVDQENQDALILSVLWFQKSAEMQALFYQGYNIAKKSLLENLKEAAGKKPPAVVMDIDETILDNSPSEASQIRDNVPFSPNLWKAWVKMSAAHPCPGALEFTQFADSIDVEVFYVSNREVPDEYTPTLLNLINAGFPYADTIHLLLKTDVSSKDKRRRAIAEKYEILLLIGDNLADLDTSFDNRESDLGFGAVNYNRNNFGNKFIVLPNPMYGPWVNAAVKGIEGKTLKDKILKVLNVY